MVSRDFKFLSAYKRFVSSAKRKNFNFVEEYAISLIYIKNNSGPNMEP